MKLNDFIIDLQAKAEEQCIDIRAITVSEDQARRIASECPGAPVPVIAKGAKEHVLIGTIYNIDLYVRPDPPPAKRAAVEIRKALRSAGAPHVNMHAALTALADYLEKQ